MYCIKCGKETLETDKFCASCGAQKIADTNSQNTHQQVDVMNPNLTDVERARIYSSYTRKLWYSALGPFMSLFLIVALWGLVALLDEIIESDIVSTLSALISIVVPVLIALSLLSIPIGIILAIIYARNRSQFKPIIR